MARPTDGLLRRARKLHNALTRASELPILSLTGLVTLAAILDCMFRSFTHFLLFNRASYSSNFLLRFFRFF